MGLVSWVGIPRSEYGSLGPVNRDVIYPTAMIKTAYIQCTVASLDHVNWVVISPAETTKAALGPISVFLSRINPSSNLHLSALILSNDLNNGGSIVGATFLILQQRQKGRSQGRAILGGQVVFLYYRHEVSFPLIFWDYVEVRKIFLESKRFLFSMKTLHK